MYDRLLACRWVLLFSGVVARAIDRLTACRTFFLANKCRDNR
jgi:hypothetical protein